MTAEDNYAAGSAVRPIRDGYHTATPYLTVKNAAAAIEFYGRAFGAEEMRRLVAPDGKVMHAEIRIGDSIIMLSDEFPSHGALSPETLGGSAMFVVLSIEDVDARIQQAVTAGATVFRPAADQFSGDRSGTIQDPFGHRWTLTTHIEDVSEEEMNRRLEAMMRTAESSGNL
ncbi:MAG TPA: VOC family protein [Chthoniobacterales bacterium]|nr:VOC family protein [Chthoniobacterales bacterium]